MKNSRNIFAFLLCLLLICFFNVAIANAKRIPVKTGLKAYVYNSLLKRQLPLDITLYFYPNEDEVNDRADNTIMMSIGYPVFPVAIQFIGDSREKFLSMIKKYKEWNKKATSKGIKLDKAIGSLEVEAFWKVQEWYSDKTTNITISFFSQSKDKHQLVIFFPEFKQGYNTHKPEALYLWWNDITQLEKAFSDKAYESYMEKARKQIEIDKEFK